MILAELGLRFTRDSGRCRCVEWPGLGMLPGDCYEVGTGKGLLPCPWRLRIVTALSSSEEIRQQHDQRGGSFGGKSRNKAVRFLGKAVT